MVQAILIDASDRLIMDAEVRDDVHMAALLLCERVEQIPLTDREMLFFDEQGLYRSDPAPGPFFTIEGVGHPIPRCGLIVGINEEGERADTGYTVESAAAAVAFPDIELVGFKTVEDRAELFGQSFVQQSTEAVFRKRGSR